jgi:O-antigen/teichoic acid export membrane protein
MNQTVNRSASLVRNVFSNWFVLVASVAFALFITPIIVRALGKELYGVWSFLNGLLTYSDVLYFGLGSALVKYVAEFRAKGDQPGMNRLASVVILIYSAIGLGCFAILTGFSALIPRAFAEPLSTETARAASYTCVLLGAQLLFVFIGSAFSGLIAGHDRYDLVNGVYAVTVAIRFVAMPTLVRQGHDPLFVLACLTSAVAGLGTLAYAGVAFWYIPGLSIRLTRPRLPELRLLYSFGLQSFFIMFAVKLISYTDTTVIGVTLGAASVALYTLPVQLVEYARAGVAGFAGVFLPRLTALVTFGDMAGLRDAYLDATRIACFLSAWLVATMICLGPVFLNRWVGRDFGTPVQWVLVYLAIGSFGQVLTSLVPLSFYQALHIVAFPAAVLMVEALLNLGLSIWWAPRIGIVGVALATAIPTLLVSVMVLPPYLCRRLGVPIRTLFVKSVMPGLLLLAATLAAEWLAGLVMRAESYPVIIGRALITVPFAILILSLTFPLDQRQKIWRLLRLARVIRRGSDV